MSKPSASTPTKSLRSRMGTIMRRSSSAISFTKQGTASRSSSESLKLDAKAQNTLDHAMPSPVPESPAREAAESIPEPEPAGPSKLSGAPISAPRDSPEPSVTLSTSKSEQPPVDTSANSSVQPVSAPALEQVSAVEVAPVTQVPSSEVVPASLAGPTSTIISESTPGPIDAAAADAFTHSPKALSHAEFEHEHAAEHAQAQEEALPVRRSEDSGSTQSHGQVIPPHERQLPTELLAAPWDNGPLVADRTSQPEQEAPTVPHAPPARVPTPPAPVEVPPANVDNVASAATTPRQNNPLAFEQASVDKSSVVGVPLKSRTRASTVSSQVRPRTPSNPNAQVSRRPSISSLASSAAVLSGHAQAVSMEPRREVLAAPPQSNRPENPFADPVESAEPTDAPRPAENPVISMPEPVPAVASVRDTQNTAPIDFPLPSANQVVNARPLQTAPSNVSAAGQGAIFSPRELEYDTDESLPLLQPSTTSFKNPPIYGQAEPAHSLSIFAPQNGDHMWPVPMRRFASMGWQEFVLPDGSRYFSNSTLHVVTDIDLRNSERLDAVTALLEDGDMDFLPPQGWELWLRDAGESTTTFIPARAWVHHGTRMVLFKRPSSDPGEVMHKDFDKSDMEYQYWSYMVSHPAHVLLPPASVSEAIDVLTWSYTDRLLPSSHPSPPPFSQDECQQLITLLRSFNHVSAQTVSVVRTRAVSKVLLRIAAWRQGRPLGDAHQDARGSGNAPPTRIPFRRTAGDFIVSLFCLGLPYLFLERSHHQRFDAEGGVRSIAGPMLVVGGFACLIAAIIISASVTFITLPGIDDISRTAGFLAILLSAFSLISAVFALFRYKSDIEHPVSYPRGEGLILLSRRSVLLSLPLVFLLYAIAAFITGVAFYALRGLSTTVSGRHFGDFTQWAVICTVGGLACVLLTSQLLIH